MHAHGFLFTGVGVPLFLRMQDNRKPGLLACMTVQQSHIGDVKFQQFSVGNKMALLMPREREVAVVRCLIRPK